jgi:predicted ATPase
MRIETVKIDHFRNILDTGEVQTEPDITCLVGKNESGKTSFLQALYRLNPSIPTPFQVPEHYPAWLEKQHRLQGKEPSAVFPVTATFRLGPEEREEFIKQFGPAVESVEKFSYRRRYSNDDDILVDFSEPQWIRFFVSQNAAALADELEGVQDLTELHARLDTMAAAKPEDGSPETQAIAKAAKATLVKDFGKQSPHDRAKDWLKTKLPKFLYFDNVSGLPGVIEITKVANTVYEQLKPPEQTAKALLALANADTKVAAGQDFHRRKRELENTANALTQEILEYWTQNIDLRVEIDFNQRLENQGTSAAVVVHELHVRLYDSAHMLSLAFDERSSGFRWFFSFLCAFSRYRLSKEPVILLLDEPALGLHAKAQRDFLRYIEEKLAPRCQVIYTTHSPFMVPPEHLHRVRLVEDKGKKQGSSVSQDVMSTDRDTLFPLQGALGYDLAQNLFVGPHNLVVEGTSDFTYLQVLSGYLASKNRTCLDARWTIVPVGGADQLATFAALLGTHVRATILLDSHPKGNQRLDSIVRDGILGRSKVIGVGEILSLSEADIEDLFEPDEYLRLFNLAFDQSFMIGDLTGSGPIVKRLARRIEKPRFDHGRPATVLLRQQATLLDGLSEATLARFERLFARVNQTLEQYAPIH